MTSKLIRYTLPLIALLAAACSEKENQPPAAAIEAPVTIHTRANGGDDTNQLNASETHVKSVRIYIFDGNKLDRMQYFDIPDGGMQLKMRAKVGTNKTFCAVANELPAMKNELDRVETPAGLNAVMYTLTDYVDPGRNIDPAQDTPPAPAPYFLPFYGENSNVTLTEEGASLTLNIERAVARVDMYLRAEEKASFDCVATTATTLKIERSAGKGYFTSVLPNTAQDADRTFAVSTPVQLVKATGSDKSSYKRIFSFYLPVQRFAQNPDRIRMTLADLTWGENTSWSYDPFLFGDHIPSFDNTIQPNKVYKLYCTLSQAAFPVEVSLIIEDWDVTVQHGGL